MLSIIVFTFNDEERIRACLESVKWADELIVVDNGSTDRTLEVVKKYTDKVFIDEDLNFAQRRNMVMEQAKGDWVLYVDSDERVTAQLKEEVLRLIEESNCSAIAISRINIIFGEEKRYGPFYPDWVIRLLKKKNFIKWVGDVHEYATFNGELGYSKNSFIHLTHRDVDQVVLKSLKWSKIDARLRLEAGHPRMVGWRFFRIFITEIFNQGVKNRGFFNGTVGIMDSLLQAFSLFITYVRLWQLQQPKPLEQIYNDLDEKLIKDGFKYSQ